MAAARNRLKWLASATLLMVLTTACGTKTGGGPYPEISVSLRPDSARILAGGTVKLWVTVLHSANEGVTWTLSGAGCSGAACGTMGSDGLYTAPGSVPGLIVVTAKATSRADPTKSASATITVIEPEAIEWAWVSGSDLGFPQSDFGTRGIPAPSNAPGGRRSAESWLDPEDNLWLFGGESRGPSGDGHLNDLWKFDPETLEWTWISGNMAADQPGIYGTKGTAAPSNVPGARICALSGSDPNGDLWLFGGIGYDSAGRYGDLNDLWKFDLMTLEWTWVSGSNVRDQPGLYGTKGVPSLTNIPGARGCAISWFDPGGNLWLFGGGGYDSEDHAFILNDLWKFNTTTLEWTWVSGSNVISEPGQYGTRNVPAPSNVPGAREWGASGIDPHGQLWLFGGKGYASAPGFGTLNDLWRFDPATLLWTWVSGSDSFDEPGNYGTRSLPAPTNIPGARLEPGAWFDADGVFWLFGGDGSDAISHWGGLNDLWKFDPTSLEWTWVSGSDSLNQVGLYGTKGQGDQGNIPGARYSSRSWFDSQGRFWLFGGAGADSTSSGGGYLNDLWRFRRRGP